MLRIVASSQFKKDLKLAKERGFKLESLAEGVKRPLRAVRDGLRN